MILSLFAADASGQSSYVLSYQQLKDYNGAYEYKAHSSLLIAASPRDTMLYAIIGDSRYKLRPYQKDVFLNAGNEKVIFLRRNGSVAGYSIGKDTALFHLIDAGATLPDKYWFARTHGTLPFVYKYHIPEDLHDGLQTGSMVHSGLDTALIHLLVNRIVDGTYPNVHSVLLIKDDKLILEEYFYEYNASTLHQLRSATKSWVSALTGIAIDKGLIKDANGPIIPYFSTYSIKGLDSLKRAISVKNLLTQQSGLACDEDDANSPGNEMKIYPTDDWVKYVLDLPMTDSPGHVARYCSGNIILLDKIIEKVSGRSVHDFAAEYLFGPLGIHDFQWDFVPDKSHEESFGQLMLRPRDMAKFGLLYLHGGSWHGKQIISKDWVRESVAVHSLVEGIPYGLLWWCEPLTVNGITYQGFAAKGNGGQRVFVWPGLNMVAVITAGNYNAQSPANKLLMECVLGGLKK